MLETPELRLMIENDDGRPFDSPLAKFFDCVIDVFQVKDRNVRSDRQVFNNIEKFLSVLSTEISNRLDASLAPEK